jgi:hypothetical protein
MNKRTFAGVARWTKEVWKMSFISLSFDDRGEGYGFKLMPDIHTDRVYKVRVPRKWFECFLDINLGRKRTVCIWCQIMIKRLSKKEIKAEYEEM